MNLLSPKGYNVAEAEALRHLPNRVIEATRCVAFAEVGYPTRVSHVMELWRYADVMQEGRFAQTLASIGGVSAYEADLIQQIQTHILSLTASFGKEVLPGPALIRAIPTWRRIMEMLNGSVLELGPGSGYVGALLLTCGVKYFAVETCQAFALWQNHLFSRISPEWKMTPWWEFYDMRQRPSFDILTANHMLNEMHPNALAYAMRQANARKAIIVIEDLGSDVIRKSGDTLTIMKQAAPDCTLFMVRPNEFLPTEPFDEPLYIPTPDEAFLDFCRGKP